MLVDTRCYLSCPLDTKIYRWYKLSGEEDFELFKSSVCQYQRKGLIKFGWVQTKDERLFVSIKPAESARDVAKNISDNNKRMFT